MDTLEDKLTTYLNGLENRLGKTEEFILSELPQFAAELLAYNFWVYLLQAIVWLVAIGVFVKCLLHLRTVRLNLKDLESKHLNDIQQVLVAFFMIVAAAMLSVPVAKVMKITLAPRVFIMETLQEKIKEAR